MARIKPLDRPANTTGLTALPDIYDRKIDWDAIRIDKDEHLLFGIALLLPSDDLVVQDEAKLLALTMREARSVIAWLGYRQLSASDHVIRKKRLEWPECVKGVLRDPTAEERLERYRQSEAFWKETANRG